MASIVEVAKKQKSFASFLQKRRLFLILLFYLNYSSTGHEPADYTAPVMSRIQTSAGVLMSSSGRNIVRNRSMIRLRRSGA